MKKISISIFLIFLIILIITVTILSTVGIETKRFNNLVTQKINKNNENISLDLNSIKFKLDIEEISLFLETKNPKIVYRNVDIPAENIKVYINFLSLKTLKPSNFVRFLKTKAKKGKLNSEIEIYLNDRNQLDNFIARGSISDLEIETFKSLNLKESSFTFFADKTDILLKNFKSKCWS